MGQRPFADLDVLIEQAELSREISRDDMEIERRRAAEQERLDGLAQRRSAKQLRKAQRKAVRL